MDNGKANWQNYLKKISKDVLIVERSLGHDDEENQKERRDQMKAREGYFSRTQKRLQSFKSALEEIKERLDDICHARVGAEVIQPLLEAFERKLTDFKIIMRDDFVDLENEENTLTRDINMAASEMAEWLENANGLTVSNEADKKADAKRRKIVSDKRFNFELERQAKIGAIDKQLISMGGRSGGWDHRDHDAFIKVWTQVGCSPVLPRENNSSSGNNDNGDNEYKNDNIEYKIDDYDNGDIKDIDNIPEIESYDVDNNDQEYPGESNRTEMKTNNENNENIILSTYSLPKGQTGSLLRRLPLAVPGKLLEELEDHITWYLKSLSLLANKKRLLLNWKTEKLNQEKENELAIAQSVILDRNDQGDLSEILREATAEIEERANARVKVSMWREQKEKEKEQKLMKAKDDISYENKLREDEVKRRQQFSRIQLDEWRVAENSSQSALKKAADEAANLARRGSYVDPAEVRRRQARDVETTKQRIEQKEAYKKQTRSRAQVISEINTGSEFTLNAKRDPERLLAPTKNSASSALSSEYLDHAERKRATVGAHSSNIAMSGRDLKFVGRAIPQWRKPQ